MFGNFTYEPTDADLAVYRGGLLDGTFNPAPRVNLPVTATPVIRPVVITQDTARTVAEAPFDTVTVPFLRGEPTAFTAQSAQSAQTVMRNTFAPKTVIDPLILVAAIGFAALVLISKKA